MENDTLTTETEESHVNTEEQVIEEQTDGDESSSYNDAWDSLDLDDIDGTDSFLKEAEGDDQPAVEEQADVESEVSSEEEEARKVFMEANPVLKFKGRDIPIESPDEIIALAQKGFLLETEQAKIKPQKKIINTVSDVPIEVLQAVADLNEGKQEALEFLRDHYGIEDKQSDGFDFGDDNDSVKESTYKPEVKREDPVADIWERVVEQDAEMAAQINKTYQELDPTFQEEVYNEKVFPMFVNSISSGEFETVYPLAVKERVMNPAISWLDAYSAAASKIGSTSPDKEVPPASAKIVSNSDKRRLDPSFTAAEIWDDDDAFEKMQREIFQG